MAALREVHDPELHRSIVDLGMVGGAQKNILAKGSASPSVTPQGP